jgi:hypothetical protein
MGLYHENRRGDVYYLQQGKTATGRPKYYTARKITGTPLDAVPEGYEIHESPEHGQVHLRRTLHSVITTEERELAERIFREVSGIDGLIVEIEKDALVVWHPGLDSRRIYTLIGELIGPRAGDRGMIQRALTSHSRYERALRFQLLDRAVGSFVVQRWCYRGSIDDWTFLGIGGTLEDLARTYATHLGRESFFELTALSAPEPMA